MKLGFIGLGHMGSAMAANLVKAGHEVTVFNRSPGKAARSSSLERMRRPILPRHAPARS